MKNLALHILDIVQNSIAAKATEISIRIKTDSNKKQKLVIISDNGTGIKAELIGKVTDPFYTGRRTRKVGLGLPLFKQNAEQTGGWLTIHSTVNKGTTVEACFISDHLDCPPYGDLAGVIVLLVQANPQIIFKFDAETEDGSYLFDTESIKIILEDFPIQAPEIREGLKSLIQENISSLLKE